MINLAELIVKYSKRENCRGIEKYPTGGKDIAKLCNLVRNLENIIRNLQRELPVDKQNIVERAISTAYFVN